MAKRGPRGPYKKRVRTKMNISDPNAPQSPITDINVLARKIQEIINTNWTHEDITPDCFFGSGAVFYIKLVFLNLNPRAIKVDKETFDRATGIILEMLKPFGAVVRPPYSEGNFVMFTVAPYKARIIELKGLRKPQQLKEEHAVQQDLEAEEEPVPA